MFDKKEPLDQFYASHGIERYDDAWGCGYIIEIVANESTNVWLTNVRLDVLIVGVDESGENLWVPLTLDQKCQVILRHNEDPLKIIDCDNTADAIVRAKQIAEALR